MSGSGTIQRISRSVAFCFGQTNRNGVGTPSVNNPYLLRENLNIALSSKVPAWYSYGPEQKEVCENPVVPIVCDLSRKPDIITVTLPPLIDYSTNCKAGFNYFYTNLAAEGCDTQPTIEGQLLCVMDYISNPSLVYAQTSGSDIPCDPVDDPFEVVVIFDNKVAVSWGPLIESSGDLIRKMSPMPFPVEFTSFTITLYQVNTKTHWVTSAGFFTL